MTRQPRSVPETFAFACGDCGHGWEATFQVMFFTDPLDPSGLTTQEYVDEAGRAVRSPLAEAVCPRCGGRQVRVLEAGLAERARKAEQERAAHPPHHRPRFPHRSPERPD